jgi:hypothetical protein
MSYQQQGTLGLSTGDLLIANTGRAVVYEVPNILTLLCLQNFIDRLIFREINYYLH